MALKLILTFLLGLAVAAVGVVWWPGAVLAFPVFVYVVVFRIFTRECEWGEVDGIKTGSVRWLGRGGRTLWLDGEWEVGTGGRRGRVVKLPSDMASLPGFDGLRVLVFKKKFKLDEFSGKGGGDGKTGKGNKRYFLGLQGAGGAVSIRVNGKKVGKSFYGFLPFEVEVTDLLEWSGDYENEVVVRVEKRAGALRVVRDMRFGPGFAAGIFRDVYLQERGKVFIEDVFVSPDHLDGSSEISILINGDAEHAVAVSAVVLDEGGAVVMSFEDFLPGVKGSGRAFFIMPPEVVKRWGRGNPVLYTIKASVLSGDIADRVERTVGFKKFGIDKKGFFINGKRERLVGVRRAELFPPYGAAFPSWAIKKDVDVALEAGVNLLWSSGFAFHPAFLDQCDGRGVYVAQELMLDDLVRCEGLEGIVGRVERIVLGAAGHPSFLFWYVDCAGRGASALKDAALADFLRTGVEKGFIAVSLETAELLNIKRGRLKIECVTVDINRRFRDEDVAVEGLTSAPVLVLDILGRSGTRKSSGTELRKAAVDEGALGAAFSSGAAGVVLGDMFGWGMRAGLFSVARRKKVSVDVLKNYLDMGVAGVAKDPGTPRLLRLRAAPVLVAAVILSILYIQLATKALFLFPEVFIALVPVVFLVVIKGLSAAAAVLSLVYYVERNPGILYSAAGAGFGFFARLSSSRLLRGLAVGVFYAWLQAAGVAVYYLFFPGVSRDLALGAFAVAGAIDGVFVLMAVMGTGAVATVLCAGLLQCVYLSQIVPPAGAVAFTAAAYLPLAAGFWWLRKKSPVY